DMKARLHRAPASPLEERVKSGLSSEPRELPAALLYDATGSALFERICTLEEYYLTRSELAIMRAHAAEMAALAGPMCAVVEYGSGAGLKIRLLLDALAEPRAYVPVDISGEQLARVSRAIAAEYPSLLVAPVHADFTGPIALSPEVPARARRLAYFPGST